MEGAAVWNYGRLPTIDVGADVTEELGSEMNILFGVDAPPVITEEIQATQEDPDDEGVLLADSVRCTFCARVDARSRCRQGDTVRLSLDPDRFHFFDPATGAAIGTRAEASAFA
jgi:multiple sugar transport system ATP-binding protein